MKLSIKLSMKKRSYNANLGANTLVYYFSNFPCFEDVYVILLKVNCQVQINKHIVMLLGLLFLH